MWDSSVQGIRKLRLVQISTTALQSTKEMVWLRQGAGVRHKGSKKFSLLISRMSENEEFMRTSTHRGRVALL